MDKLNTIKIFLYENKRKIIVIACLLIVMLTITLLFLNKNNYKTESLVYENLVKESSSKKEELNQETELYYVDVKGEVTVPGVYSLNKGKRVVDAINIAGGVKEKGDTSLLNLSMELRDGMVIIVYSKDEIKDYELNPISNKKEETICNDKVINDACWVNSNKDIITNISDKTVIKDETLNKEITTDTNKEAKEKAKSNKEVTTSKININSSTIKELMTLPGIGESKAQAIVDYRTKNGNFQTIQDIKKVSGIGDATFEKFKDQITI